MFIFRQMCRPIKTHNTKRLNHTIEQPEVLFLHCIESLVYFLRPNRRCCSNKDEEKKLLFRRRLTPAVTFSFVPGTQGGFFNPNPSSEDNLVSYYYAIPII